MENGGVETLNQELSEKQIQFNDAMKRYQSLARYQVFNVAVSSVNVALQTYLLVLVWPVRIGPVGLAVAVAVSFVLTDFLNGLVHMMMDNNDSYDSVFGPFVANFHLHHKIIQYKKRPLPVVYFNETGSKVWLVGYLSFVLLLFEVGQLAPLAAHILVYVGILSSLAEVSHYLAHSSTAPLTLLLGRLKIILPKRHHAHHHLEDNRNYAFLNGMTDPLLNIIARAWYPGYKKYTDTHYAYYAPDNLESR
ncbi:hypothetical protein GMLC_38290 [Geomonas limicola]|uniref:Lipid desaturase domain-containing protein n=1 Tax=Geomonas limicola TaxID=2740186 RepID=A0A6V8NCU4_9BACT|nr:fatty acid desaturase CarF family protein [Geomonas limicola]GFO70250.1 hypothetical protein GMLC_38290 [Geomonas limicola]